MAEYLLTVKGPATGVGHSDCVNLLVEGNMPGCTKGNTWGYIEDPEIPIGTIFRLILIPDQPGYARPEIVGTGSTITSGGQKMTGQVFEGVVVKTTQVSAGEGLTSSVPKSEIVLVVKPFIAKDAITAQAVMLATAKEAGHDINSPIEVLEVKVRVYA